MRVIINYLSDKVEREILVAKYITFFQIYFLGEPDQKWSRWIIFKRCLNILHRARSIENLIRPSHSIDTVRQQR